MPLQPNRSGIFLLFICLQPYPAAPRQLLAPLLPSDRFQKPTTWGQCPCRRAGAQYRTASTRPRALQSLLAPQTTPLTALLMLVMVSSILISPLVKKCGQEPFKALPACQDAYSTLRCAPQQAVTPLCLFILAPYPLADTLHTGYHKIFAYARFSEKMQEFSV